ncbi:MAG TPA: autotransporter domain-containing protein [Xanthobacteraceae bacterium]|nr:autotransporter domain-containing protein [Xanthobacteraceae bacterium]
MVHNSGGLGGTFASPNGGNAGTGSGAGGGGGGPTGTGGSGDPGDANQAPGGDGGAGGAHGFVGVIVPPAPSSGTGGAAGGAGTSSGGPLSGGGGGGGGAGGYGAVVNISGGVFTGPFTGGNGGSGGNAGSAFGLGSGSNAGDGGAGGVGLYISGVTATATNNAVSTGGNGGNGGNGGGATTSGPGNGGYGGSGGAGVEFYGTTLINQAAVAGGNGGNSGVGGSSPFFPGADRDGGGGGNGITHTGNSLINTATITGGAGGASSGFEGVGGTGGHGVLFTTAATFTNSGAVSGGAGGTGGGGGANGPGVRGADLTINNNAGGTISGGGSSGQQYAIIFTGGANTLNLAGTSGAQLFGGIAIEAGSLAFTQASSQELSNVISGAGSVTQNGAGTLTLSGVNTYTGATNIADGTLALGASGSIASSSGVNLSGANAAFSIANGGNQSVQTLSGTAGTVVLGNNTLTVANGSTSFGGEITGGGGFALSTGTQTFSATNSYTGATTINGGTLIVNGSIATSSLTTVNNGGTLAGTGTAGATQVNSGGTFAPGSGAPGTSTTVQGSLAFASGATYLVQISPAATSSATVTGLSTLAGTVDARFAPGSYVTNSYIILTANGGRNGTFSGLTTTNLPASFGAQLAYQGNTVRLSLFGQIGLGSGLNQDQQSVANTLNTFFNNGGALPPGFVTVFGLSGAAQANALTQLSGEHATGIQPAANLSTSLFLNAMIDPFVTGRTGGFGQAMGYAQEPSPSRIAVAARDAFAADMPVKAPVPYIAEQRWSVWGAAYGGRNRTDGDAVVGSNDVRATTGGFAAGADYRVSPDSVIGAAVAIGETRWNVSALGKGNADVAQIGGYASSRWGALYVSGAASVGWHRAATDRTLTIAGTDRLEADFNATSFGGRLEGGYRYGSVTLGLTPYAAVHVTGIHTPAYAEAASAGANQFALSYGARSTNDIRSELGFWADTRHAFGNGAVVVLRGRAAWVHDYNPGSHIQAAFQTLPGTSFVVNGAAAPRDAALTSAVAEVRMTNGWSLISKFDGEFSGGSRTLAGTGTMKYTW